MEVAKADMIAAAVRDDIKRYPTFHHAEVFVVPAAGGPDSDPSSTSGTSG
jgi:hypothetical protein